MKLAFYSGSYSDLHGPYRYPVEEFIRIVAEAGWDGVEIESRHFDPMEIGLERQNEIVDTVRSHGLEFAALHAGSWYTVKNPAIRHYRVEMVNRLLMAAKRFGIPIVNTYTGGTVDFRGFRIGMSEEEAFDIAVDCLKQNCRVAENLGIPIGLEAIALQVARDLESTRRVIEAVSSPMLGINLCVAQYAAEGKDPAEGVRYWKDQLKWVHLHDYAGSDDPARENPQARWAPLGKGDIDWQDFFASLKEIGYDGWLCVDYGGNRYKNEMEWLEESVVSEIEFIRRWL